MFLKFYKNDVFHLEFSCTCVFYRPEYLQTRIILRFEHITKTTVKLKREASVHPKFAEIISIACFTDLNYFFLENCKYCADVSKNILKSGFTNFRFKYVFFLTTYTIDTPPFIAYMYPLSFDKVWAHWHEWFLIY